MRPGIKRCELSIDSDDTRMRRFWNGVCGAANETGNCCTIRGLGVHTWPIGRGEGWRGEGMGYMGKGKRMILRMEGKKD